MYDRQVSKQGVADRVVDELNPDNVLWTRDSTNLLNLDDTEPPEKDLSPQADDYADEVLKYVLKSYGKHFTKVCMHIDTDICLIPIQLEAFAYHNE